MLQATQMAEDNFLLITRVSHEAVGLSLAFLSHLPGGGGFSNPIIGVYPSQAEDTMRRYASGNGHSTTGPPIPKMVGDAVGVSLHATAAAVPTLGRSSRTVNTL